MNVCNGKELFKTSNDRVREMLRSIGRPYDEDKEDWDIQNKHS